MKHADRETRTTRAGRTARHRARLARAAMLAVALGTAGCGEGAGSGALSTGPLIGVGVGVGGGSASAARALVGRWTRLVLVDDGFGGFATSETTWDFAADSVATRANITMSSAWTAPLVTFSTARWRTEGSSLVVRYVSPDTGTVRFRWRIEQRSDGTLLFLDETAFARVTR